MWPGGPQLASGIRRTRRLKAPFARLPRSSITAAGSHPHGKHEPVN